MIPPINALDLNQLHYSQQARAMVLPPPFCQYLSTASYNKYISGHRDNSESYDHKSKIMICKVIANLIQRHIPNLLGKKWNMQATRKKMNIDHTFMIMAT